MALMKKFIKKFDKKAKDLNLEQKINDLKMGKKLI